LAQAQAQALPAHMGGQTEGIEVRLRPGRPPARPSRGHTPISVPCAVTVAPISRSRYDLSEKSEHLPGAIRRPRSLPDHYQRKEQEAGWPSTAQGRAQALTSDGPTAVSIHDHSNLRARVRVTLPGESLRGIAVQEQERHV
jgi:hypothetical protein